MKNAASLIVVAFALSACGRERAPASSSLDVVLSGVPASVTFGAPFDISVTRTWPTDVSAAAFDPATLAPLVVDGLRHDTDAADEQVTETWVLRARVLEVGEFLVRGPVLTVAAPGRAERQVRADDAPIRIVSGLDDDDDGSAELPDEVLELPTSLTAWWLAALAGLLVLLWARPRKRPEAPEPVGVQLGDRERLVRLAALEPRTDAEWDAFAGELADIVRGAADASATSEEVLARLEDGQRAAASDVLALCDGVKFARARPTARRRAAVVEAARGLVEREP